MIPGLIIGAATVRILFVNIAKTLKQKRKVLDEFQAEGRKQGLSEKQAYQKYKEEYRRIAKLDYEREKEIAVDWMWKLIQIAIILVCGFICAILMAIFK